MRDKLYNNGSDSYLERVTFSYAMNKAEWRIL